MWEKEKMLVTSIFSFPQMFSSQSNTEIIILATMNSSSAIVFNLDYAKILLFGKELYSLPMTKVYTSPN